MELKEKHILVVDDNLKNLQLAARILKDEGYLISVATDGAAALSLLSSQIPDLILLDIMMPGMDGLELCRKVKAQEQLREIPIIFLTAKSQTEDLIEGFKAGGVDYVTKPFKKEELLIRVKNHLELALSRRKIIDMNRTRDKLYSIIAHDIRSPLAGILITISAIKNNLFEPGTEEFDKIINSLEKTTNETTSLLNNLLAWTKVKSENITVTPKHTNLNSLVSECLMLHQMNFEKKNIQITMDIPERFIVYIDEVTMHTVFRNLISNAVKFTPQNGSFDIRADIDQKNVMLSFKDSGIGMSPEVVDKIFKQNQHHTSFGTDKEQGSGLGLIMVKDFVEMNKGSLDIESQPGLGTEIRVTLPLNKSAD